MAVYGFTIKDASGTILLDQDSVALNYIGEDGGVFEDDKYYNQGHIAIPCCRITLTTPSEVTRFIPGYKDPTYNNYMITPGMYEIKGKSCNAFLTQKFASTFADGDTITIGNRTYRFKTTPVQANDITIDNTAGAYNTMLHLKYAINGFHILEGNGDIWCFNTTTVHSQVVCFALPNYISYSSPRSFTLYANTFDFVDGEILISSTGNQAITHPASFGDKVDIDGNVYAKRSFSSPPGYCPLPETWWISHVWKYKTNNYMYNDSV